MDDIRQTLVILLSMHRCGSSFTASVLQRLGMSLGPFELNEAAPSNPYGHFEAIPFLKLNRRVQEMALGFPDDLPTSPEVLARLRETQGVWPDGTQIPDELFVEGRSLIQSLIESGEISGFKDPRTVLTWPFWERVFNDFPGLRIVPISLLRSPHEIAMSLVTRRDGWVGYWPSLDVVAVHLRRQKAILERWGQPLRGLCFGSPSFLEILVEVTQHCGLAWNPNAVREAFDQSCVHQTPAVVSHEAQDLFDSLCPDASASRDLAKNRLQLVNDARYVEALRIQQWQSVAPRLAELQEQVQRARSRADLMAEQLREAEARVVACRLQQTEDRQRLIESQHQLITSHHSRNEIQDKLIQSQAREVQLWQQIEDQHKVIDSHQSLHEVQDKLIQSQAREAQLWQQIEDQHKVIDSHQSLHEVQDKLIQSQAREAQLWQQIEDQHRVIDSHQSRNEVQDQLIQSQAREVQLWQNTDALRGRLERYESHPLLGPALRGRRRLRSMLHSIAASSTNGTGPDRASDVV
jgi:hypothetical protein